MFSLYLLYWRGSSTVSAIKGKDKKLRIKKKRRIFFMAILLNKINAFVKRTLMVPAGNALGVLSKKFYIT